MDGFCSQMKSNKAFNLALFEKNLYCGLIRFGWNYSDKCPSVFP